jgi:hypothetical protein
VGFQVVGKAVEISAPAATAGDRLVFTFRLDAAAIPPGHTATTVVVLKNCVAVADCTGPGATPDPCVATRVTLGDGDVQLGVRTSSASTWTFVASTTAPVPALSPRGWVVLATLLALAMGWAARRRRPA